MKAAKHLLNGFVCISIYRMPKRKDNNLKCFSLKKIEFLQKKTLKISTIDRNRIYYFRMHLFFVKAKVMNSD